MSIEKVYYDYAQIEAWVNKISFQLYKDAWRPDYIVGLTRGGLIPAVIMSNRLGIPMETLKVSLRDSDSESESNLWMAEDAYGYGGTHDGMPIIDEYKQKKKKYCRLKMRELYNRRKEQAQVPINQS